ncbi:MAG: hypothetical protein Q7R44_01085, partial [bacterium]|nr:hypothetical protein [bacterium]
MNKYLPIIGVVVIGLGIAAGAFFFFNKKDAVNSPSGSADDDEVTLKELPMDDRPYATLTPRTDGHEFHLTIEKIAKGSTSVEYELVYKNADGVTQGVPGTIKFKGEKKIERDLLLGSCSSGKCKYDEGVEEGTFTLKLRDEDGKLITKMETGFHLQKGDTKLSTTDGKFSLNLDSKSTAYFLTMGTFGIPKSAPTTVAG